MTSFIKQFYDEAAYIPPDILVQHDVDEAMVIEEWLRKKRGTKVAVRVPHRGQGQELMQMAAENASETLAHLRAQWEADQARQVTALEDLHEYLHLPQAPTRIECYDISNIQGRAATGSMVVFVKGVAFKSDYRRFRIKTVEGANDYAMLQEVLRRRFKRAAAARADTAAATPGEAPAVPAGEAQAAPLAEGSAVQEGWGVLPDLLIVDGGKGQLHAALEVMAELGVQRVPAIGLAKQREEVFVPRRSDPILLPRDSEGLYLLQRVRDEAHRFAIGYHRKLRDKAGLSSQLEEIPGIGPKRRQALLKRFGSLDAIREASVEELAEAAHMTHAAAEELKERI
jgi:excinuclease ABC subunit C